MSTERWLRAQTKEKEFWLSLDEDTFRLQSEGYKILAAQLQQRIDNFFRSTNDLRVLQVGCAVEDCIFYLPYKFLVAVDPLAAFYKSNFRRSQNPAVDYQTSPGEDIPFGKGFFHVVISNNMLDHVINPSKVMSEIIRVLREEGLFFLSVDVYSDEEAERRLAIESNGVIVDECHPHTFTRKSLEKLVTDTGLQIIERFDAPSGKGDESIRFCIFSKKVS